MEFETTAVSAAPPEQVFALLAAGDRWQEWAGVMVPRSAWHVPGDPVGSVGAVRRLGFWPFVSLEQITRYEPPYVLGYQVVSGAPFRDYRSTVTLTATPEGGTRISWRSCFEPRLPGTARLLAWFLHATVASFARNLAKNATHLPVAS